MERIKGKIRGFLYQLSNRVERARSKIRSLVELFGRTKRQRVKLAKWLFEKLLGSFLISLLILYGSFVGLQLHQSAFQTVYSLVTLLSVLAYVLSVVLIPSEKEKEEKVEEEERQQPSHLA